MATVEIEMTGLGGAGVIVASQVLTFAAASKYKHVNMLPGYSGAQRGGDVGATLIFSDEEIACPILVQAQYVMVFHPSKFKLFEERARPGGTIIVESTGLHDKPKRKDVEILPVPARETAVKMGYPGGANLILLGAFIGAEAVLTPELIEAELKRRFATRANVLSLNMAAFREGVKIGTQLKRKEGARSSA